MTSTTKLQFTKNKNKALNNEHILIQFEIKIIFQNEMQNLVEFVHFKKYIYS